MEDLMIKNRTLSKSSKPGSLLLVGFSIMLAVCLALPLGAQAADKLIVKDSGGTNTVFVVTDQGQVGAGTGTPHASAMIHVLDARARFRVESSTNAENAAVVMAAKSSSGVFGAGGLYYVGADSAANRFFSMSADNLTYQMVIKGNGYVGIGTTSPLYPLHMGSGARVTTGGVWTDASSRDLKENITELSTSEALTTLVGLNPVKYNYKVDQDDKHVGFIAEDVPDLVATNDRKGMSPMDVVAVLTKVVQEQQKTIEALNQKMVELEKEVKLKNGFASLEK
jgi:hypothetical protein